MGSWAQGESCSCELLMNAAPLGLVVGRASGEASAVFGCGRRGAGGAARLREESAEKSTAKMANSPAVSEPGGSVARSEGGCKRSCW